MFCFELLHTHNDGSGLVLWVERAAAAPVLHHDLTRFISFQGKGRRVLETNDKKSQLRFYFKSKSELVRAITRQFETFGHFGQAVVHLN